LHCEHEMIMLGETVNAAWNASQVPPSCI
jgi:hypothetical protein